MVARKLAEVASKLAAKPVSKRQVVYIVDFENIPRTDVAALLRKPDVIKVVLAANHTNTVTPGALATIEENPERVDVIIGRITRKEFVDKLVTAKIGEYAFRFPEAEIIVLANDKDYGDLAAHLNDHWERPGPIQHEAPGTGTGRRRTRAKKAGERPAANAAPEERAPARPDAKKAPAKQAPVRPDAKRTRAKQAPARPDARKARTEQAPARPDARKAPAKQAPARPDARKAPASKPPATAATDASPAAKGISNPDARAVYELLAKLPKQRLPRGEAALLNAVRNYRESVGLRARPSTIVKILRDSGVVDTTETPVKYTF